MKHSASVVILALATAATAVAQSDLHACQASPQLMSFYSKWKTSPWRVEMLRERLAADPENLFLNRWYLESPQLRAGSLNDEYRKKLEQHTDDPRYLYLYGRALMGADTPKAIDYLNRAVAKDPDLPWTYWSLMEVYASPNFKNAAKLSGNMLAFTRLCPAELNASQYLRSVEDKETLRELAARLRKAVEGAKTISVAGYYPALWSAEFRITNPRDFDKLRKQVAEDLKRVKELDPNNSKTLSQGYRLIGDAERAKALEEKSGSESKPKRFHDVFEAWQKEHPWPKAGAPQEEVDRFSEERLKASEQWVKDWPDESNAQYWRLVSLNAVKSIENHEVEEAGEKLLEMTAREPNRWSPHPYSLAVAQEWNKRDIRLKDCIRLAEQAIAELDRGPASENDMLRGSQSESLKAMAYNMAFSRFGAFEVEAEASRKLKDFEKTRAVIREMKTWLDRNKGDYMLPEWICLVQTARLAEAEGHKLDALAYYQRAINRRDLSPEVRSRARALWQDLGGSQAAFEVWSTRPEPPAPQSAKPAVATGMSAWTSMEKPLSALNAWDITGKSWTVADLRGRTTLINVWATWCGPCRGELPYLQKLFDQVKERKDIQVISINVDENPGLVGPFVQENHYTFPVVLAKSFVDQLVPSLSIPRNWISDPNGILRLESIGFDSRSENWPQQMIEKLSQPLQ